MAKKAAAAAANAKEGIKAIPCEFGGVSIGETTARIGVRIVRGVVTLTQMDALFCGRRITGRVIRVRAGDTDGQKTILGDIDHFVTGAFDSKRIGATMEFFSAGLTFNLAEIDVTEMAALSKGHGRIEIESAEEIPEEEGE